MATRVTHRILTLAVVAALTAPLQDYLWPEEPESENDQTSVFGAPFVAQADQAPAFVGEQSPNALPDTAFLAAASPDVAAQVAASHVAMPAAVTSPAAPAHMSRTVADYAKAGSTDMVEVIVRLNEASSVDEAALAALGAEATRGFSNFGFQAIRLPANALERLSEVAGIDAISLDAPVEAASIAARETAFQPSVGSLDYVSVASDVGVAVLDSGISQHGDLNVGGRVDIALPATGCAGYYADEFNALTLNGDDGSRPWLASGWTEVNDNGSVASGKVSIVNAPFGLSGKALRFAGSYAALERTLDLAGATTATCSTSVTRVTR